MKKASNLQITELYLIKADWHRTFMGTISREKTPEDKDIIYGKVTVLEGRMWAMGETEEQLGACLDDMCKLKLDHGLHSTPERVEIIAETLFFLN